MVSDEDEAKDVLQDTFVEAFTKLEKLKEVHVFSAWIKRIAINKCLNVMRKKKLFVVSVEENHEWVEEENDYGDQDIIKSETRRVMQAIEHLAPGGRAVFNLYLFEGYDHKEIAQILKISESASKAQYCKAKAKVRNILLNEKSRGYGIG